MLLVLVHEIDGCVCVCSAEERPVPAAGGTHARGEGGTPPSLHLTILISQMLFSWLTRLGCAPCYGDCKRC